MENLMETTAWSMLHSLWIGALIYGLLQLGLYGVGYRKAAWRSALAYIALFGMFAGFVLVFWYNLQLTSSPGKAINTGSLPSDLSPFGESGRGTGVGEALEPYFPYLVSGYVAGLLFQLVLVTYGIFRIRRLQCSGLSAISDEWQQLFETALAKMRISRQVGLFLSSRATSPIVVGFIKPMVLIPISIINHLDLQQAELILLHELAHIRRHDYLLNLLKSFIESFLFFNPFVWLCGRIIQAERENACDDMVIHISSRPIDYAHTLFRLAAHSVRQKPSLALGAAGQHKYHLLQRIKRMTNMNTKQKFLKQPLLAMLLAVLVAGSLAWVKPQEQKTKIAAPNPPTNIIEAPCDSVPDQDSLIPPPLPPVAPEPPPPVDSVTLVPAPEPAIEFDMADTVPGDTALHFFKSPAWKKQVKEIQQLARVSSESARRNADSLRTYFHSTQWKKQLEEIHKQAGLARIQGENARRFADSIRAKFDSPEWKKKIRQMSQVYNSPEYKRLKAEFDLKVQALKESTLKDNAQ